MTKMKGLILVAISVIVLGGGGVFTVGDVQAEIISEWNDAGGNQALGTHPGVVEDLFFEPKAEVEKYSLVNADGQTGNDSATEITSGGLSIPQTYDENDMWSIYKVKKDNILDDTDPNYTVPMQDNGIVIVGDALSTHSVDLTGTRATMVPGTCIDNSGVSHAIELPSTGGWYRSYDQDSCAELPYYSLQATETDLSSEEYSVMYNDVAMWENGTTPYILDMKIEYIDSYATQGNTNLYATEGSEPYEQNKSSGGIDFFGTIQMNENKPQISSTNGQQVYDISFEISDTPEYGYVEAGKTPEEVSGSDVPVNLMFTDIEGGLSFFFNKDDVYGITIPYCDVKYNTDFTVDTANTDPECLTTTVSAGDSDGQENDFGYIVGNTRYDFTQNRRGYIYSGGWILDPSDPDALLNEYIMDQRLKVYKSSDDKYLGVIAQWENGNGYEQTATNFQVSTKNSSFRVYQVLQTQWKYLPIPGYDYQGTGTIIFASTEEPIVSMAKVQEDAGIDGKGVNDNVVAPGETVHYRLYAINSGFDGVTGYRFYDDVTNLLEYTGVISNVNVQKITGASFSSFLAEYTQYMNDPTSGDIPACGSAEATYTCEVATFTNNSSGGVVDIKLNEALPTQTAYELSFDVEVAADYNGQTDKRITNTGYLTEPGCPITSGVPSSSCSANESVTIEYGSIALKISKDVNDTVDSTYTPSEGISANGDTYASSEEWLNYTLTITNASADGALNVAQDIKIVDDLTLDTNLSKIDPATIVVTSSIGGALVAPADYTDASTATKLDITLPAIEVDETITITFKAQAL